MTKEEKIKGLYSLKEYLVENPIELEGYKSLPITLIVYAIEALEQEPKTFKWCTDCKEYDTEKHCCHRYSKVIRDTVEEMKQEYIERDVIDKIRAEIKSMSGDIETIADVLAIIDKYKGESEEENGNN